MDDVTWQVVARLADADRAHKKELVRCYGARAVDWLHATRHTDPGMQSMTDTYRAAQAAYTAACRATTQEPTPS